MASGTASAAHGTQEERQAGDVDDLGAVRARRWPAGSRPPPRAAGRRGSARRRGPAAARGAPRRPGTAAAGRRPSRSPRSGTSRLRLSATTPSVVPTPSTSSAGVDEVLDVRAAADAGEEQVGRGHDQAGQQRRQRRAGEPAVRLQDAGEHDADAVEHHLRGEDEQEAGGQRRPRRCRRRRAAAARSARRAARSATASGVRTSRVQPSSADAVRRTCSRSPDGDAAGEHRDDEAGQRTAGDDLEHDVRDGVGGQVGVTGAVGADGVGEDQRPAEAGEPGQQGEDGDQRRGARRRPGRRVAAAFTTGGGRGGPVRAVPASPR